MLKKSGAPWMTRQPVVHQQREVVEQLGHAPAVERGVDVDHVEVLQGLGLLVDALNPLPIQEAGVVVQLDGAAGVAVGEVEVLGGAGRHVGDGNGRA